MKNCFTFFSLSSRCDDIVAEVKGGNFIPPAAGGWRGGPAAAGLTRLSRKVRQIFKAAARNMISIINIICVIDLILV